ncbi:MAG: glutamate-cysteine ligase family protein [Sporichthyaceae bacterium]
MHEHLTTAAAATYVASTCFKTGPPRAVGVELEWLLVDAADPFRRLSSAELARARAAAAKIELTGARLTVEPGGQLELSSLPFTDCAAGVRAMRTDAHALRGTLVPLGLDLHGIGLDPWRAPTRLLDLPRYAAMEDFFDRRGPAGRTMMCSTAAVQVNVDAGPESPSSDSSDAVDLGTRWALLHELAPVLTAAFANSPVLRGPQRGLRAGRAAVWRAIDPSRTAPARPAGDPRDPRDGWVSYVLDAEVLCIQSEGPDWSARPGLRMRDWLAGEGPRRCSQADLDYHLTTLFPPVRARGHLELRTLDAQRDDDAWTAALALVWSLCSDAVAADAARDALGAVPATAAVLDRAQRDAMADCALAGAALACFEAAGGALERLGARTLRPVLDGFAERYPVRGRCPADDTRADLLAGRYLSARSQDRVRA